MAKHWPPPEALANWDIGVESVQPVKDVFKVTTPHGIYCLKPSAQSLERLLALDQAMDLLVRHGFLQATPLILTKDGNLCAEAGGVSYYLTEWFEGEQPDIKKAESVRSTARCLGEFHLAARGLSGPSSLRNELGRWPERFANRREDLVAFRREATERIQRTRFDRLYLERADEAVGLADRAINLLASSGYPAVCEGARQAGCFCHGDVASRNFIAVGDTLFLIDFDSLLIDLHLLDLGQLVRRTMKHCHWNVTVARELVSAYTEVNPLSGQEHACLAAFVAFPQKLWRLANRYYREPEGREEKEMSGKLAQLTGLAPDFTRFAREFPEWLTRGGTV